MGDNLGLNQMLGFLSSFNGTYCCRICLADREQARELFEKDPKLLRNRSNYNKDVENAALTGKQSRGVKERSVFESLVHVTEIRTIDPLHDLQEGDGRKGIGGVIHQLSSDKDIDFDIEYLNTNINLYSNIKLTVLLA